MVTLFIVLCINGLLSPTLEAAQAHLQHTDQIQQVARPLVERLADAAPAASNAGTDTISYGQLWWDEVTQPFQRAIDVDNGALNVDNVGVAGFLGAGIPHAFVKNYFIGCAIGCAYGCCKSGQALDKDCLQRLLMAAGIPCVAGPCIGAYIAFEESDWLPFLLATDSGCGTFPGCAAGIATGTGCVGLIKEWRKRAQVGYQAGTGDDHATQTQIIEDEVKSEYGSHRSPARRVIGTGSAAGSDGGYREV